MLTWTWAEFEFDTIALGNISKGHDISFHCYADDTQFYFQTQPNPPACLTSHCDGLLIYKTGWDPSNYSWMRINLDLCLWAVRDKKKKKRWKSVALSSFLTNPEVKKRKFTLSLRTYVICFIPETNQPIKSDMSLEFQDVRKSIQKHFSWKVVMLWGMILLTVLSRGYNMYNMHC